MQQERARFPTGRREEVMSVGTESAGVKTRYASVMRAMPILGKCIQREHVPAV